MWLGYWTTWFWFSWMVRYNVWIFHSWLGLSHEWFVKSSLSKTLQILAYASRVACFVSWHSLASREILIFTKSSPSSHTQPLHRKMIKHNCKDTIPLRPNEVVGLAHERSLTIWFVESGLEKLGFGHGAMFRSWF